MLYLNRVANFLPIPWIRLHLNIYADDYQVGGLFYSISDLKKLLTAIGILLDTLREFALRINTKKSAALLAIAGTSHRHQRAQFVVEQKDVEQLRIPLPTGTEALIPLQSQITYLGTVMSYKDCITATLKHRLTLARIAQRRLGRWLRGKHDFKIHSRFQLWRSTVLPVLTYGIFATGIHPQGIMRLQREMYKMLRQVVCDHASRTGHTNYLALTLHSIATPLQQLRAAAEQLLQSITQRLTRLQADDITLQLPWDHLNHLVTTLANTQELSSRSVEPSSLCVDPSSPDLFNVQDVILLPPTSQHSDGIARWFMAFLFFGVILLLHHNSQTLDCLNANTVDKPSPHGDVFRFTLNGAVRSFTPALVPQRRILLWGCSSTRAALRWLLENLPSEAQP